MAARLYVVVSFFFSVAITTAAKLQVPDLRVENYTFSSTVKPPGSSKRFFLGGAGVRGLKTNRQFVKFTVIGVYLEKKAFRLLAPKWRHKTVQQLLKTDAFTSDIIRGRFDKFTQVTTILPLTGPQYSEKVAENMVLYWKSIGTYTDAEAKAVAEFLEAFKNQNFPPGSSILFTQSHHGFLTISFSKHGVMPKVGNVVIKNKQLSEGVLESIIAKNGVSPATRQSLAVRLANFLAPPRFY